MIRELQQLLKPYLKSGWRLDVGKHYKLYSPKGSIVVISKTSSCKFYLKHVLGDIKRAERRETE